MVSVEAGGLSCENLGSGLSCNEKNRDSELELRPGEASLGRPETGSGRLCRGSLENGPAGALLFGIIDVPKLGEYERKGFKCWRDLRERRPEPSIFTRLWPCSLASTIMPVLFHIFSLLCLFSQ